LGTVAPFARWMNAYTSKVADNVVQLHTEDAQYISGHVAGLVAKGRDALIANFQIGKRGGGHIDSIEILDAQISCNPATLLCTYHATNSGAAAIGRNRLVSKKVNGAGRICLHMTVV
jgi:ketosteroid isomerase-like protein